MEARERCLAHSERGWNSMKQTAGGQVTMHVGVHGLKCSAQSRWHW